MRVEWSSGWLLDQMTRLAASPEKWWNEGGMIGFGLDDPDHDPLFDEAATPPDGWERLPFYEEVSDG